MTAQLSYLNLVRDKDIELFEPSFIDYVRQTRREALGVADERVSAVMEDVMERPLRNWRRWPMLLLSAPLSAILGVKGSSFWKIAGIVSALGIAYVMAFTWMFAPSDYLKSSTAGVDIFLNVASIAGGLIFAFVYLRKTRNSLATMMGDERYGWLSDIVRKDYYNSYPALRTFGIFKPTLLLSVLTSLAIAGIHVYNDFSIDALLMTLGALVFIIPIRFFFHAILATSVYVMMRNSILYGKLVSAMTSRLDLYNNKQRTLIHADNYEIVFILGETSESRLEALESVPFWGGLSAFLVINALLLDLFGTLFIVSGIEIKVGAGSSVVLVTLIIGLAISLILAAGVQVGLLFKMLKSSSKFKSQAREELDRYIYEELMSSSLGDVELRRETTLLFFLRQYINEMKLTPVSIVSAARIALLIMVQIASVVKMVDTVFAG